MTELPLDDNELRWVEQRIAQINALQCELQGALNLLLAQNGLTGDWRLDAPGKRLIQGTNHESHTPNGDQ